MLWLTCLMTVRNQRILTARQARHERHTHGTARPRTRKRRRELASATTDQP